MKKISLLPLLCCTLCMFLPATVQAERVDIEKAEKVARSYARSTPRLATRHDLRHTRTVSKRIHRNRPGLRSAQQQDEPVYHVFSLNGGGGFIIISGDDVAKPVLGYADQGAFDETNPNLAYWLETLSQEIVHAVENDLPRDAQTQAAWDAFENGNNLSLRAAGDYVDPLIKTKWNQTAPYSNLCPNGYPTGCVATAMAQIMYHHRHPTTYQWGDMTPIYTTTATGAAATAVASLMRDCGLRVNMNYGAKESSASSGNVPVALRDHFGYDQGVSYLYREYYSYAEWVSLIKAELKANRPVYYSGNGSKGGHAFVCDGYNTDDLFHFNWGWSGLSDGYFELSALNPESLGIGGGAGGYNNGQTMVIGIRKPAGGHLPALLLGIKQFSSDSPSLSTLTESFFITFTYVANRSIVASSASADVGVLLCQSNGTQIAYQKNATILGSGLTPGSYYPFISQVYSLPADLAAGTYRLYPAYRANGQMPATMMRGENGEKYINVVVSGDKTVTLSDGSVLSAPQLTLKSLTVVGRLYYNKIGNFKADIENAGLTDYNACLKLTVGSQTITTDPVVIPAGSRKTVNLSGTILLQGSQTATLYYDPNNVPGNNNNPNMPLGYASVTVGANPGPPSLTATATFTNQNNVSQNAPNLKVVITNSGGIYTGPIEVLIFPEGGGYNIGSFGSKNTVIEKGQSETLVFNDPIDFLAAGAYFAGIYYFRENETSRTKIGNNVLFTVGGAPGGSSSTDATLKSLVVKDQNQTVLPLTPVFAPGTTNYTVNDVSANVTHIDITGEPTHARAKVDNISGTLNANTKTFMIQVTAEDGQTKNNYTVTVNKTIVYGVNISVVGKGQVFIPESAYKAGDPVTLTLEADDGYRLDVLSVYKNDDSKTTVRVSGNNPYYTFTMPAYAVTVAASFVKTDATLLGEAVELVEKAAYTVEEATANTVQDVKAYLVAKINALPGISENMNAVSANDLTLADADFYPAGDGKDGSFTFTATLRKGAATPRTTQRIAGTIKAEPFYAVIVVPATNGTVDVSPATPVHAGATVTVTLAPDADCELASIRVYRTDTPATTVTLSGSDLTRTFTMPAYDVTVEAFFLLPGSQFSAQEDVNRARALIENTAFDVLQSDANTLSKVQTWLLEAISSLITESTGVSVTTQDITISAFQSAVTGTAASPAGTNGSFSFTVSLTKGDAAATTSAQTGRITAETYMPPVLYAINLETSSNGRVAANVASALTNARITLTLTPDVGYEPDDVRVRTANGAPVTLSGSGNTRTFTMPAGAVIVTVDFKKTQERVTVEEAKSSVEDGTYRIAQATGNTEAVVKTWLTDALSLLLSGRDAVINFLRSEREDVLTVNVTLMSFTPAVSGTEANAKGVDGSYLFTVVLMKGDIQIETMEVNGVIVAMPYFAVSQKRIELLSMGETRLRVVNTGNRETGKLRMSLSGADANEFMFPSSEVPGNLTVGSEVDFTLVPRAGLAPGTYKVTVTVGGDGLTAVSLEVTHRVLPVGNDAIAGAPGVWAAGHTLYIAAATSGEARVFNLSGQLVKVIPHTAGETVKTILPQGLYVITAEGKTSKVMIER